MKEFYTKDELEVANSQNIVDHLKSIGYELSQEGNYYRGKAHNSLVISGSTGKWRWNSLDVGGTTPTGLLSLILQNDYGYDLKNAYMTAIKTLAQKGGYFELPEHQTPNVKTNDTIMNGKVLEKPLDKPLILPEKSNDASRAINYLCNVRKLDFEIVADLFKQGKIFEAKGTHNVCFVSSDANGNAKHAFLRGIIPDKPFKQDVAGSNKSYPFAIMGDENATKVCCFESAIDCISHASLYKLYNLNPKDVHRIALHGTSFLGLERFLSENKGITEIVACLDNDATGNRRADKLCQTYKEKGFSTFRQSPTLKDFNEQLQHEAKDFKAFGNDERQNQPLEVGGD